MMSQALAAHRSPGTSSRARFTRNSQSPCADILRPARPPGGAHAPRCPGAVSPAPPSPPPWRRAAEVARGCRHFGSGRAGGLRLLVGDSAGPSLLRLPPFCRFLCPGMCLFCRGRWAGDREGQRTRSGKGEGRLRRACGAGSLDDLYGQGGLQRFRGAQGNSLGSQSL